MSIILTKARPKATFKKENSTYMWICRNLTHTDGTVRDLTGYSCPINWPEKTDKTALLISNVSMLHAKGYVFAAGGVEFYWRPNETDGTEVLLFRLWPLRVDTQHPRVLGNEKICQFLTQLYEQKNTPKEMQPDRILFGDYTPGPQTLDVGKIFKNPFASTPKDESKRLDHRRKFLNLDELLEYKNMLARDGYPEDTVSHYISRILENQPHLCQ